MIRKVMGETGPHAMLVELDEHIGVVYKYIHLFLSNSVVFIVWGEYSGHTLSMVAHSLLALLMVSLTCGLSLQGLS